MKTDESYYQYYDNCIDFFRFSEENSEWATKINRVGTENIFDYYERTSEWLASLNNKEV
jgi:hypothetical protein